MKRRLKLHLKGGMELETRYQGGFRGGELKWLRDIMAL